MIFLVLKSTLSKTDIAIPAFFWLILTWYIFLYPFALNLDESLYVMWVFKIYSDNLF